MPHHQPPGIGPQQRFRRGGRDHATTITSSIVNGNPANARQRLQRPQHAVVLDLSGNHVIAGAHQSAQGRIERMGAAAAKGDAAGRRGAD